MLVRDRIANTGACRVAHSNMGGHGGRLHTAGLTIAEAREEQRKTQRNARHSALGGFHGVTVINPADYMADFDGAWELESTTFGAHELERNWRFSTQRYRRNGNAICLRGVTQQL